MDRRFHEAGHAVAAYCFRYPHKSIHIRLPFNDQIENSGLERDNDAVEIGRAFLQGLSANRARMVLAECTIFEMGYAVNILLNQVPENEANGYADDNLTYLEECFRLSNFDNAQIEWARSSSWRECRRLIEIIEVRNAIEAISDSLINNAGHLSLEEIHKIIETVIGTHFRANSREPEHVETELAAYHLYLHRGSESDAVENWLTAERGLRFGIACRIE